jgi:hypothetical protein
MEYKALISVLAQSLSILRPLQQLWQLGDIGRYPPRLIACEQVRRRPPSGLGLEIHVSQRLTIVVADDEATAVVFLDVPRRWEAARLVLHRRESWRRALLQEAELPAKRQQPEVGARSGRRRLLQVGR